MQLKETPFANNYLFSENRNIHKSLLFKGMGVDKKFA